jgi:hypothetical protein
MAVFVVLFKAKEQIASIPFQLSILYRKLDPKAFESNNPKRGFMAFLQRQI